MWYGVAYHVASAIYQAERSTSRVNKARFVDSYWLVSNLPTAIDYANVTKYFALLDEVRAKSGWTAYDILQRIPLMPVINVKPPSGFQLVRLECPFLRNITFEQWLDNIRNEVVEDYVPSPETVDTEEQAQDTKGKRAAAIARAAKRTTPKQSAEKQAAAKRAAAKQHAAKKAKVDVESDEDSSESDGSSEESSSGSSGSSDGSSDGESESEESSSDDDQVEADAEDEEGGFQTSGGEEERGLLEEGEVRSDEQDVPMVQSSQESQTSYEAWEGIRPGTPEETHVFERMMSALPSPSRNRKRDKLYEVPGREIGEIQDHGVSVVD